MILAGEPLNGRTGHDAGRELLEKLYRQYIGRAVPQVLIAERGKPYYADSSVHFSITHTKGHVFCALSERPIGIDAEEQSRDIDLRLADKILSPGERAQFDEAKDQRLALLKLWVLKEAAAKRSGEGLRGYPRHTDFSPDDLRVQRIDGCYVAVIEGEENAV